ncbi:MAG: DUF1549 and DUF1553 domain-containing protein [Planctomycetes bacterium]|nr:DUF1549 and DUF1553 domain-containing protein [Planctomycetota bacterium]
MLRRSPFLALLAVVSLTFGVLSQYDVFADEKKTEAKKDEPALGQDPHKLADGLSKLFDQLLAESKIKPSKLCDDDTFLRRAYLDLVGRPPLPREIDEFNPGSRKDAFGNKGDDKRPALIDRLLESPEHARHFADMWTVITIGRDADGNSKRFLRQYLETSFAQNKPWSEMVYDMVAVIGDTTEHPEVGYLMSFENKPQDMVGITSKVFLGKQIQCAECHDHPYEDFTQNDFRGMQAFFTHGRTGARGDGANRVWYTRGDKVVKDKHDALVHNVGKQWLYPQFIGRESYELTLGKTLRQSLAEWMTSPDNTYFREMGVNRYMAYFLGMGFVTPVDDFNSLNEPSFPKVLEIMGKDFAASGYDTRYLIRAIMNSDLYQREVDTNRTNRNDFKYYSRAYVRKLTPEQIHRSILHVVGIERLNQVEPIRDVPENQLTPEEKASKKILDGVNGWKGHIYNQMRIAYGAEPDMRELGDYDGTIVQALMLLNSHLLGPGWLTNSIDKICEEHANHNDRVRAIFMTVLGRRPTARDAAIMGGVMANWGGGNAVYEDLFVALMNTTEFATNH